MTTNDEEAARRQAEIERADAVIAAAGFERITGTGRWRHPATGLPYTWDEALAEARVSRPGQIVTAKDQEIARLRAENADLTEKLRREKDRATALYVDGNRREERALALLPDCEAHASELQYLRHCVSWYWENAQTSEEARHAIVGGLLVTAQRLKPDVTFTGAELAEMLRAAVDKQSKPLKRKGRYPTLADCIRAGGCDHDGLSDSVKADIAEALGLTHTHAGSACGGYKCPNCKRESATPFRCPCGAGQANHVLIIPDAEAVTGDA